MAGAYWVDLVGNVGKDPEVTVSQSGRAVARFPVATIDTWYYTQRKMRQERTDWHFVEVWGKPSEVVGKHVKKGHLVRVFGALRTERFQKNGRARLRIKIVAKSWRIIDRRDEGAPAVDAPDAPGPAADSF